MKYYISTIADLCACDEDENMETVKYIKRTAPIVKAYNMGIEIAEFCISENMDKQYDAILPHVLSNIEASENRILHAPYCELYPMAIEPLVVEVAYKRYMQALEYCRRFGAHKMVAHANYIEEEYYPGWFVARHIDFWKKLLSKYNGNVIICLENVRENDPELILAILRTVDDLRLRMCLDIGHANLTEIKPGEWIKICAPYISHYHIHNNFGAAKEGRPNLADRHLPLGNGSIDMKGVLQLIKEFTPDATVAIESNEPEECVRWLRDNGFIK